MQGKQDSGREAEQRGVDNPVLLQAWVREDSEPWSRSRRWERIAGGVAEPTSPTGLPWKVGREEQEMYFC